MTSTFPYGPKPRNDHKRYIGNYIDPKIENSSINTGRTDVRDYLDIKVHGFVPEKSKAPPLHDYLMWGVVIATIGLWIFFSY